MKMKSFNTSKIIGVDHGYGNMKTANFCFPTGIIAYDSEPLFTAEMLVYDNKYYLIGEGHKEFAPDKIKDEDYYILTLAAIAKELKTEDITEADIHIAAGLPLTWTSGQKADFAAYLAKDKEVDFTYKKAEYHIRITGVSIYPQGYAAIAPFATKLTGINLIADIGNGTMNVNNRLNEFSIKHGLPHLHPHMFRHTAASIMLASGVDVVTTAKMLGHSPATALKVYAHEIEEAKRKASESVAGVVLRKNTSKNKKNACNFV